MNGESSLGPNFASVDDEKAADSVSESSVHEKIDMRSINEKQTTSVASCELEYLKKKRNKLRLFDPAGVYDFRHVEISYTHSLCHVLSLCCSLFIFYGSAILTALLAKTEILGLGEVSDLPFLDKIGLTFVILYPLIKISQILTTKVSEFNKRYQLAMCANAFNLLNLNGIKFVTLLLAIELIILVAGYGELSVNLALAELSNGFMADTLSALTWVISVIIAVKAFKYCGKGKEEQK
ncbi:hypothetical protein [Pseudoalteromonas ruthenica]|uniref:hypothetical protein n=1 Tax=Pseudoalteromonas ruthenica TaxID=151081 RepID=UPI000349F290|nr:hypothetical protein [Pseudoalteromonas ruthenica]